MDPSKKRGEQFTSEMSDFIVQRAYENRLALYTGNAEREPAINRRRNAIWEEIHKEFIFKFCTIRTVKSIKDHMKYRKSTLKKNVAKWNSYLRQTGGGLDAQAEKLRVPLTEEMGAVDYLLCRMNASTPGFEGVGPKSLETGTFEHDRSSLFQGRKLAVKGEVLDDDYGLAKGPSNGHGDDDDDFGLAKAPLNNRMREQFSSTRKRARNDGSEFRFNVEALDDEYGIATAPSHGRSGDRNRYKAKRVILSESGETSSVEDGSEEETGLGNKPKKKKNMGTISEKRVLQEMAEMYQAQKNAFKEQAEASRRMQLVADRSKEALEKQIELAEEMKKNLESMRQHGPLLPHHAPSNIHKQDSYERYFDSPPANPSEFHFLHPMNATYAEGQEAPRIPPSVMSSVSTEL